MRYSFMNAFVSGATLYIAISLCTVSHAGFLVETPFQLTSDHSVRLAVSSDGKRVLVAWDDQNGVYKRVSNNHGVSFQPEKPAVLLPPEYISGLRLKFETGSVPLLAANGRVSRLMASLGLDTDPYSPPPGLPPALHVSNPRLYESGPPTSVFRYSHWITMLSNPCTFRLGLVCSSLREFDAAMSNDAALIGVIWNAYGFDGQQGDTWFAAGEAGDDAFDAALNLSELVTPGSAGNDFDPRIEISADGSRVFALWTEISTGGGFFMNFTASLDGGSNWSPAHNVDAWYGNDMAYADESAELFLAYSTGYYFLQPPASIQVIQSSDDGATFTRPVTIAVKRVLDDGTEMIPTYPVRVSSSVDGKVIAVLHTEEPCDPIFGCGGGSVLPFDVVLSVSEDGGASLKRIGVIAQSYSAQSLSNPFDIHVRDDGGMIFIVSDSTEHNASVFYRAVRQ